MGDWTPAFAGVTRPPGRRRGDGEAEGDKGYPGLFPLGGQPDRRVSGWCAILFSGDVGNV